MGQRLKHKLDQLDPLLWVPQSQSQGAVGLYPLPKAQGMNVFSSSFRSLVELSPSRLGQQSRLPWSCGWEISASWVAWVLPCVIPSVFKPSMLCCVPFLLLISLIFPSAEALWLQLRQLLLFLRAHVTTAMVEDTLPIVRCITLLVPISHIRNLFLRTKD